MSDEAQDDKPIDIHADQIADLAREIVVDQIWRDAISKVLDRRSRAISNAITPNTPWGIVSNFLSGIFRFVDGSRFDFEHFAQRFLLNAPINPVNRDLILVIAKESRTKPHVEQFYLDRFSSSELRSKEDQLADVQEQKADELRELLWAMPELLETFRKENVAYNPSRPMGHIYRVLNAATARLEIKDKAIDLFGAPHMTVDELMLSHGALPVTHNFSATPQRVETDQPTLSGNHLRFIRDIKRLSTTIQTKDMDWVRADTAYDVLATAAYLRAITDVRLMRDRREVNELFVVAGEGFALSDGGEVDSNRVLEKAMSLRAQLRIGKLHLASNGKLRTYQDRLLENYDSSYKTLQALVRETDCLASASQVLNEPSKSGIDLALATLDDLQTVHLAKPQRAIEPRGL